MKARQRKRDHSKKNKNAGMSLLEVIIAVSIFSIAAIVLLQGFVTSSRINRKSNLYLEATSTAQNVMEEIKARPFEEVSLAFNYPIDLTTGESRFTFLNPQKDKINTPGGLGICEKIKTVDKNGNSIFTDVRLTGENDQITASVISQDNGKTYKFNPRKTGENASKYYFQMTNVTNLHETFDILAEFDGSKDSGYKKANNLVSEDEKNDMLSPNIAKLDSKSNGFLIMPKEWDHNAMENMVAKQLTIAQELWNEDFLKWRDENKKPITKPDGTVEYIYPTEEEFANAIGIPKPTVPLDQNEVYKKTKRTLQIDLSGEGSVITAKARYTLNAREYKDSSRGKYGRMDICCDGTPNEGGSCKKGCCMHTSVYVPFYSTDAGVELKNIYIFYYPNYESTNSAEPLDVIEFDNKINYPLGLYVVKQQDEANSTPSSSQEISYKAQLIIQENPTSNWNTNPTLFRAQTKLRTNLDTDISARKDGTFVYERPSIHQMTLIYTDEKGYSVKDSNARKVLDYNGLDDRRKRDRIYTAKIGVYKKGAAEKNFPNEDLIVQLDGTKED